MLQKQFTIAIDSCALELKDEEADFMNYGVQDKKQLCKYFNKYDEVYPAMGSIFSYVNIKKTITDTLKIKDIDLCQLKDGFKSNPEKKEN